MKIDGLTHLLQLQQKIAKSVTGAHMIPGLFDFAKAASTQRGLIKGVFTLPEMASQLRQRSEIMGLIGVRAEYRNPFIHSDFAKAMKGISENSLLVQKQWGNLLADNPLVQMGKRMQEQQQAMMGMYKPYVFSNIAASVLDRLNDQADRAATLVDNVEGKKYVSEADIIAFKQFVETSFDNLSIAIEKAGKSPKVIVGFWLAVFGFLMTIYTGFLQPLTGKIDGADKPATQEQVEELKEMIEKRMVATIQELGQTKVIQKAISLRLKPKNKTIFVCKLKMGDTVNVITTNHKWAYVTIPGHNNLPISGWLLKKYLN